LIACIAWYQLDGFNRTTKSDFAHKLKRDFFNKKTMELVMLFEYEAIEFVMGEKIDIKEWEEPDYCPYYKIRTDILKKVNENIRLLDENKKIFTTFEIESLVLNHFEDLYKLMKDGILDFEQIEFDFSVYLVLVMKNKNVWKHINYFRGEKGDENYDPTIYEGCEFLYNKMKPV
jgi:hypothetical protein